MFVAPFERIVITLAGVAEEVNLQVAHDGNARDCGQILFFPAGKFDSVLVIEYEVHRTRVTTFARGPRLSPVARSFPIEEAQTHVDTLAELIVQASRPH